MIEPAKVFNQIGQISQTVARWTVPAALPYLNGHFPENPIFPAVGIIDASTYLVQRNLNRPDLQVQSVDSAKFLQPIIPDQTVLIELANLSENTWQIEWKEDVTGKLLATLKLSF